MDDDSSPGCVVAAFWGLLAVLLVFGLERIYARGGA